MRSLTSTLTAAQKAMSIAALARVVFSKTGQTSLTYGTSRILNLSHEEDRYGGSAEVTLDNSDDALTELDLRGYTGTISYGATTSAGAEYSACAPLIVIGHRLISARNVLTAEIYLASKFWLMKQDRASVYYVEDAASTNTVKTLFNAVAGATLTVFNHCLAYTVVWDSEDSLVDVFTPKDTFYVNENESRFNVLRKLLSWTTCIMRMEADGSIHVRVPTTS